MLKRDDDNGGDVFVASKQYVDAATDVMGAAGPVYLPSSTYVSQHHVFANNDSSASMFQEVPSERVLRLARTGALGSSNVSNVFTCLNRTKYTYTDIEKRLFS
jgi:hypothetical protein